ncbi:MAG: 16S rRNA (cytidine(1402)-2'-O)-methyltransferase [Defluviitaleaceae bacterium]|nr:16S rRNA (cytidine(1402)-2'-O)-methyltransferase [Defluviitaleaceae bacterium]
MPGKLYIVATPIGNLSDMTPRGVQVLSDVDMVAAEDTRHSRVLLSHFGICTPLFSCHKFNEEKRGDFFVSALLEGKDVALISDAGTPCISDPGHRLVARAAAAGVEVVAVCGVNAATAALSVSGFNASQFIFLGFLPRSVKEIQKKIRMVPYGLFCPIIFYESPLRIAKTLAWLGENYPNADVCLCNDLTKKFERVYRGTPKTILDELSQNSSANKGEYTCVVLLNAEEKIEAVEEVSLEAQLVDIIVKEDCTLKDAANILHSGKLEGIPGQARDDGGKRPNKKSIYAATLRLKELLP